MSRILGLFDLPKVAHVPDAQLSGWIMELFQKRGGELSEGLQVFFQWAPGGRICPEGNEGNEEDIYVEGVCYESRNKRAGRILSGGPLVRRVLEAIASRGNLS